MIEGHHDQRCEGPAALRGRKRGAVCRADDRAGLPCCRIDSGIPGHGHANNDLTGLLPPDNAPRPQVQQAGRSGVETAGKAGSLLRLKPESCPKGAIVRGETRS